MENTFIADLFLDSTPIRPVLHRTQLPKHVLPKITKLVLVVDATRSGYPFCDFSSLQALTALKSLRLTAIESTAAIRVAEDWEPILNEILIRVPKNCTFTYGNGGIEEVNSHAQEMLDRIKGYLKSGARRPVQAKHTEASVLEAMAKKIPEDVKGSKNGKESGRLRFDMVNIGRLNEY